MTTSFYNVEELKKLGIKKVGKNVLISRKASIYSADKIEIGDNVRIDDFCILSGNISIGNYIHIAAYSALYGGKSGIEIQDFANISSRVIIYAVSDDYSGKYMTNPMVPEEYTNVQDEKVLLKKHVIIGTNVTVLPGIIVEEGTAIGSMSLVKKNTNAWSIYAGIPGKKIKDRYTDLLELEEKMLRRDVP